MGIAILLHVLAAVVWVGGMFFAYMALRPVAASLLEPPERLALWAGVLGKFFFWVIKAIVVLLVTGFWIVFSVMDGFANAGLHVHIMLALGLVMILMFLHVFFSPFKRLKAAVAGEDWATGGKQLAQIRRLVGINLILGLITVAVASGGRYLF